MVRLKCSSEMLKTKNTRHVIRILKIGVHGQNHAILSNVRVWWGALSNLLHTSNALLQGKPQYRISHIQHRTRQIHKGTKLHIIQTLFLYLTLFQVILILLNDSIAVVGSMMQDGQCNTLPHNCKKCHCTDIKM